MASVQRMSLARRIPARSALAHGSGRPAPACRAGPPVSRAQGSLIGLRPSPAAGNPSRPSNASLAPQCTCGIREPPPLPLQGPGCLPRDEPFVGWRADQRIEGVLLAVAMSPPGLRELTLSRPILPVSGPCRIRLNVPPRKSAPPFPQLAGPPGIGPGFGFPAAISRLPVGNGRALRFSAACVPVVRNPPSAASGSPGPRGTGPVRRFAESSRAPQRHAAPSWPRRHAWRRSAMRPPARNPAANALPRPCPCPGRASARPAR